MSKAAFTEITNFDGKDFNDADFNGAEFSDKVTFRNARFTGRTNFHGAIFKGVADFTGARFQGEADFSGAAFNHDAHFSEIEFSGDSDFSNTSFHAWALFSKSRFGHGAAFRGANFRGSARFTAVDFAADADFRESRFIAYADFPDAAFHGKALFAGAKLECKSIYKNVTFAGDADFSGARCTHPVNFSAATFGGAALFEGVVFLQFVDFKEAQLRSVFVLSPPAGSEGLAPEIRFESVTLAQPDKVRFSNISFEKITLMGTNVAGIHFENPKWPMKGLLNSTKRSVVFDEIQKDTPDPQKLAQLYKDIRANLKKADTTRDLGDLLYSEMEVRRKQRRDGNDRLYFFRRYFSPYTLLWLTCGYGARPLRAIAAITLAGAVFWSMQP
ncbi:MAG TPA: pentapeptide repeat-containing protein [Terriglobia bacterium]|jgi:uncharacterized protein YjbI with pentapeptide repeats